MSIRPLAWIVEQVVGEKGQVVLLMDTRLDPHSFELKASQLKDLDAADLIVINGLSLEFWLGGSQDTYRAKIVNLSQALSPGPKNSHTWLNPAYLMLEASFLTERLCGLRPNDCPWFRDRLNSLLRDLKELDEEIVKQVSTWRRKSFVSDHAAWTHFAQRFGLLEKAILNTGHFREATAKDYEKLFNMAKSHQVSVFFVDSRSNVEKWQELAKEASLEVVLVDHLGTQTQSYIELMNSNVSAMSKAMR